MSKPENPDKPGSFTIWEPRWHDRVVLIADHRLLAHNEVIIEHKDFPEPFYLSGKFAKSFPLEQMRTEKGGEIAVRAIPLIELEKEVIYV